MGTQVDSIAIANKSIQKNLLSSPEKSEKTNLFEPKVENQEVGDTISFAGNKTDAEKTEEEKKSKRKKWLIAAGIAVGTIAIGVAAAYFLKNRTPKIAGDAIEKFQHFDDFEVFKDLKMCETLSLEEKKKALELLQKEGNKDIFLATLTGDKPMAYLSETVKFDDSAFNILKKLKLGDNFEWVSAPNSSYSDIKHYGEYFINRTETLEIIKKNKDIFASRLGLSSNTSVKDIYEVLFNTVRKNNGEIADDLLGLALGFPKYDTMIFNLEKVGNLTAYRTSPDFIPRLLEVLKSDKSPYKNLSESRLNALQEAIKNINPRNLENIAMKGSYTDGLYAFINFCDDTAELERIAQATANYKRTFAIV